MFSLRLFFLFAAAIILSVVGAFAFFGYKSLRVSENIRIENKASSSFLSQAKNLASSFVAEKRAPLRGETDGRVNILLLGRAGERYPGKNLTDTVMMMSVDTEQRKVALLSLPRDLYAPIPDTDLYTKINSMYQYGLGRGEGIDPIRKTVEHITGQPLHYFVVLDFDGFEKAVEALGGIPIDVVRDFHDERYPGKHYSYETFEIRKGWQTLDGATALKYVRERHDDPEGDFGRAKRQQQVLQAIRDKAFSVGTFLNVFAVNGLLDALGESVKTDMDIGDLAGFIELSKTIDTRNIASVVVDAWKKESLLRVSHIQVGPVAAFILVPRIGSWSEIHDVAENIFRLDALKERQAKVTAENAAVAILYGKSDSTLAQKLGRLIRDGMSLGSVDLVPLGALENRPERSIITDRSGLRKPFSLDELLKRFSLERVDSLAYAVSATRDPDLIIVIGDDMADMLDFEENTDQSAMTDDAFSEALPPQPRLKKNQE